MRSILRSEEGVTLIELLTVLTVIAALAGLSIVTYTLYRLQAEYTRGTVTLRNAKTAYYVGEIELPEGFSLPYTLSSSTGQAFSPEMSKVLPGANAPSGVRLGVEVNSCDENSSPFDREAFLVAQPCLAKEEARWQKFCGGIEISLDHLSNPAPCS